MPISSSESLFFLVQSLTKSEKRAFKLYARRSQGDGDLLYLTLFDIIDKMKTYEESTVREKIGRITNASFSNLKKHLYEQIMISLRLLKRDRQQNIKIREYIDFAYVLYGKGLHMQALEILGKAKKLSTKHYNDFSLLTIIEFEKMIHSRHITRSKTEPIKLLIDESITLSAKVSARVNLSNIRLELHKLYIERGHIDSAEERDSLMSFFSQKMQAIDPSLLDGLELIYYYQSYVWYYYILDKFDQCLVYSLKWVEAFKESMELQLRDIDLYMRGYHYVLTSAFNIKDVKTYEINLTELEKLRQDKYSKLNLNSQIVSFQYVHNGRMNLHFLQGSFEEGLINIPNTQRRLKRYQNKLDIHKVMIINYKMAWMYLGAGDPEKPKTYLSYIMNMTDKSLRNDIQCYARLMHIMASYDAEDYSNINKLTKQAQKFVQKVGFQNVVVEYTLDIILEISMAPLLDRKSIFIKGFEKLLEYSKIDLERRAFIYLDILPWFHSKVNRVELSESVRELNASWRK